MSPFPFTLEQLRVLKAIATTGSFTKAAKELSLSQPGISLHVQSLEKKIGFPLLTRSKRKAVLTGRGKVLLEYAKQLLTVSEEAYYAVTSSEIIEGGNLRIGGSQTIGTYLMPRVIGVFRHKFQNVEITLTVHSTRQIAWGVANGLLDLAVVGGEIPTELHKTLEITSFAEDELALILPHSHPLAHLNSIQKEDLYRLDFIALETDSTIRKVIEKTLIQSDIDISRLRIEMELNSIEAIKNAVQAGLGAAFVSASAISKELELGLLYMARIDGIIIKRSLSILRNPKKCDSQACRIFKKQILEMSLSSRKKDFIIGHSFLDMRPDPIL